MPSLNYYRPYCFNTYNQISNCSNIKTSNHIITGVGDLGDSHSQEEDARSTHMEGNPAHDPGKGQSAGVGPTDHV